MNYTTIIIIVIMIVFYLILDKIFNDNILKMFKVIKYIFVPYGLLMWVFEIYISKKVNFSQFGFIYNVFTVSSLALTWLILKGRFGDVDSGRITGLAYFLITLLLFMGFILSDGFIDTYMLHKYAIP